MLKNLQRCRRGFSSLSFGGDKVIVTAALNGVLTDPKKFPNIPVTPSQMAQAAAEAQDAGASCVHIHFRDQRPGKGHLPSWDPSVASACVEAIRDRCPDLLVNLTTGTFGDRVDAGHPRYAMSGGELGPTAGPIACLEATRPDMAALNSGSLNYLKATSRGAWAWPPMMFDNPVEKVETMLTAMRERAIIPECECFDTGIVRSLAMYEAVGLLNPRSYSASFVMGVASGMPADPKWLPLLLKELPQEALWQTIAIGRQDTTWPLLRRTAELGGNVRTGLEDTMYLPDGRRADTSGQLIEALVTVVREVGREPCTPAEARMMLSPGPPADLSRAISA